VHRVHQQENNARLKEKGFYKQYYQQNAEELKQADKEWI
jgi:hypothetical protein